MSSVTSSVSCTHDVGPGITVCLRCRKEQRQRERARERRLLGRGAVIVAGLAVAYVAGSTALHAMRGSSGAASREARPQAVVEGTPEGSPAAVPAPAAPAPVPPIVATGTATAIAATVPPVPPAGAPLSLVVPEGRTELPDSVFAVRAGDSVVVSFDTQAFRTRRRDKLESVIRTTLPALYGGSVDPVLAAIPAGGLVTGGDLLTVLPATGVQVPVRDGWVLRLWPETRPGRDGPLVVRYRARVTRG